MRAVYICHPISGEVEKNLQRVEQIIRTINLMYPDVFPYAHYIVECRAMNDAISLERQKGFKNNYEGFKRGWFDEMWLYGSCISLGMAEEIKWARKHKIPITPKTPETSEAYVRLIANNPLL